MPLSLLSNVLGIAVCGTWCRCRSATSTIRAEGVPEEHAGPDRQGRCSQPGPEARGHARGWGLRRGEGSCIWGQDRGYAQVDNNAIWVFRVL